MLSHGPRDALRRVHIPLIAPAALTAALLVFVDTMKELPATLLMRPLNSERWPCSPIWLRLGRIG